MHLILSVHKIRSHLSLSALEIRPTKAAGEYHQRDQILISPQMMTPTHVMVGTSQRLLPNQLLHLHQTEADERIGQRPGSCICRILLMYFQISPLASQLRHVLQ